MTDIKEPTLNQTQNNLKQFEALYAKFEQGDEKYIEEWLANNNFFWFWDRNKRIRTTWKKDNGNAIPDYGKFVMFLRSKGYWLQGINYYYVIFKEADTPRERLLTNSQTLDYSMNLKKQEYYETSKTKQNPKEYFEWIKQESNDFSKWID